MVSCFTKCILSTLTVKGKYKVLYISGFLLSIHHFLYLSLIFKSEQRYHTLLSSNISWTLENTPSNLDPSGKSNSKISSSKSFNNSSISDSSKKKLSRFNAII